MTNKRYEFDAEGNIQDRQGALKEIEEIERTIESEEDPAEIQHMQSRWNYLMSVT